MATCRPLGKEEGWEGSQKHQVREKGKGTETFVRNRPASGKEGKVLNGCGSPKVKEGKISSGSKKMCRRTLGRLSRGESD